MNRAKRETYPHFTSISSVAAVLDADRKSAGLESLCSTVADATNMLASGAAFVMVSPSRPTIDPSISLKTLFGVEDADTVGARALH